MGYFCWAKGKPLSLFQIPLSSTVESEKVGVLSLSTTEKTEIMLLKKTSSESRYLREKY